MFNKFKEQQQTLTGLTLTQNVLSTQKLTHQHRQTGQSLKGPVASANAPIKPRNTTVTGSSFSFGAKNKSMGVSARMGSA